MALATGSRIGPYEVVAALGAGGMGEVYRARDRRLERDVAIKALPDAFARDPERVARFEREAKLLASLNHPNIGSILGLEEAAGQRYLVLEYVEGETLAARLARGPLPLADALDVCRQVAAGVEAAHESGVVHRDLKPGNVMLRADGTVKVLDFGLAKGGAAGASSSDPGLSASPTMTYAPTGAGVILGTAAYMSPEQARGKAVDRRTDIWSFGCVLYECLAGRPLVEGETVSDVIARILEREPDWSTLPASTPPHVRALLRRCLVKDPRERLRDIGEARIALSEAPAPGAGTAVAAAGARAPRPASRVLMVALALVAVAALALAALVVTRRPAPRTLRVSVLVPEGVDVSVESPDFAISPDGRAIVFVGFDTLGASHLWLRPLAAAGAHELAATDDAELPFWSPDSREVAFFAHGSLKRMPIDGESAETICPASNPRGAAWGRTGTIVFAPTASGPLMQVSASGGAVKPVTTLDASQHENAHRFPSFLPDGRHFLYAALPGKDGEPDTRVGSLDGGSGPPLVRSTSVAVYAHPGYLVYVRDGSVVAQPFDAGSRRLTGAPHPIRDLADAAGAYAGQPVVTVADDGTLLQREPVVVDQSAVLRDRSGRVLRSLKLPTGLFSYPRLSPDGTRFAASRAQSGEHVVPLWMIDLARGTATRFTFDGNYDASPVWTADGRTIYYGSARGAGRKIYRKRTEGSGAEELVADVPNLFNDPSCLSSDGHLLLYRSLGGATGEDVWMLRLDPVARAAPLLASRFHELDAALSPDGRWIAYRSDESGRFEIYVESFPALDRKTRVSTDGTTPVPNAPLQMVRWRRDGRELFFLGGDGQTVMSVAVGPGPSPTFGAPHALFRLPRTALGVDVSADGQRILSCESAGAPGRTALNLVMNWTAEVSAAR